LVDSNKVPSDVKIGVVEFGMEAFYATENVTFSAKDFSFGLGNSNGTVITGSTTSSSNGKPPKNSAATLLSNATTALFIAIAAVGISSW